VFGPDGVFLYVLSTDEFGPAPGGVVVHRKSVAAQSDPWQVVVVSYNLQMLLGF
jgi:hypothetical protein